MFTGPRMSTTFFGWFLFVVLMFGLVSIGLVEAKKTTTTPVPTTTTTTTLAPTTTTTTTTTTTAPTTTTTSASERLKAEASKCGVNAKLVGCGTHCPQNCQNYHLPQKPCTVQSCYKGCRCRPGYVYKNGETGDCVRKIQCSASSLSSNATVSAVAGQQ